MLSGFVPSGEMLAMMVSRVCLGGPFLYMSVETEVGGELEDLQMDTGSYVEYVKEVCLSRSHQSWSFAASSFMIASILWTIA